MDKLTHLTNLKNLPLSFTQKRLWIICQQDKLSPAYNIPITYHLKGKLDIDIFRKSLALLFERQHTVFSVFKQKNGTPYIEIVPKPVNLEQINFSDLPVNLRKEAIISYAGEDSRKWFDTEEGPLFRLLLLKEDDASYYFHATFQHLIFDAWSQTIFVEELSRIYTKLNGGINGMPDPIIYHSYDFTIWEKNSGLGIAEKTSIDFWKENLENCLPFLEFPYDYPRKNTPSGFGYRESMQISKATTSKLRELAQKENSTIFKIILSVLGVLIQKYTGENDICIGVPVSNRRFLPVPDNDSIKGVPVSDRQSGPAFRIFGLFVNTTVVRLKIDGKNKFIEHINYATRVIKNAILHSKLPFEKIVEVVNPERVSGINPLFQIALSWGSNLSLPMDLGGISGTRTLISKGVSPFDITFYMWENESVIEGEIEYSSDLMKQESIVRLRDNFLNLIANLAEDSDIPIDSVSMISDEEKMMIDAVNETHADFSEDKTIIRLFEERAVLDPDKTAITGDDGELTYSELNTKANRLAEVLQTYNIGPGHFIGLLVERSPELIICLLAVFKIGAAYIPLNLNDPENRILSIIDASDIKFVITNVNNRIELKGNQERLNIEELISKSANTGGTVKNVVLKNELIKEAIVLPDKSDRHNIKVILFITTVSNSKLEITDLKRELRRCLPEYMIPADIIHYAEFPVTANGKVNTKALLTDYTMSIDSRKENLRVLPVEEAKNLTTTQKKILNIWCEALNKTEISITDNFFDVGGHSLLATSIMSKINSVFNIELGLRVFFDSPRIKDLAETLEIEINKLVENISRDYKERSDSKNINRRNMKFSEFLTELEQKDISISFSEGKIKYTGPEQYINPQFIENLKMFKGKLIKHLWPKDCTNMMPINPEGNKTPFILLHGEKMNYPLSEYFGTEQPFYGFFHYGSEGEKIFHRKVEAFAKDYITQLRKIVPNGPYYLAGFSFGGLIAFEMAIQLQKQGFEVPVLILIDCRNPHIKEPVNASGRIAKMSNELYNYSKDIYYRSFHKARNLYYESFLLFNSTLHNKSRNYYIMGTYMEIAKRYKPKTEYNGEILLFKSQQNKSAHKYLGWDHFCKKVNMVIVEGNHKTLYETDESYKVLSKNIGEWMGRANENLNKQRMLDGNFVNKN